MRIWHPINAGEAVARFNERPISALTMRLAWPPEPTEEPQPNDFIGGKGGNRTLDPGIMSAVTYF